MDNEDLIPHYCHRLVMAIEETRKHSLRPSVREAFLHVPRHLFVDAYYEGKEQVMAPLSQNEEHWYHWLAQIYRDEPLVTQRDERGMPTSSSSQPSVMAGMLEALNLHAGQAVLEIGTGTGYNAALLAKLVEDPHLVTTVDIDPTLINVARSHIEQAVGSGMTIRAWNGVDGYAPLAPYDGIIATGSFFPVPRAWIEQLRPGGRLVMDLHGQMGGGLIVIIKQPDGQAVGHFLTEWRHISFMRLRSTLEENVHLHLKGYQHFPLQEQVHISPDDSAYCCASHFATFEQFRGHENAFNTWLQWIFPTLSITWKGLVSEMLSAVLTDHASQTVMRLEPQEDGLAVVVRGERQLWSEIFHAYQDWLECGRPELEAYTLCVDPQGQQGIQMDHQGNTRFFPLRTA
ncbi:MAG: methyltransferase domain-containing protein [Ktedonobacteraceae bacterium]|nr:methyltransferase domain-containing protein [Ktedonobacteraceae bacterium]